MRRSITPIIAVVLLLLLTVAIATVTYFWISSLQVRLQQSPSGTVQSITGQKSDKLKIISLSNESVVVQDTSGANASSVSVLVDGVNRTVNFTQQGQFITINWDTENVTLTGKPLDVDIIIDQGLISYDVGIIEGEAIFTGYCGNNLCKAGKETPLTCPEDCDKITIAPLGGRGRLNVPFLGAVNYKSLTYSIYDGNWQPSIVIDELFNSSGISIAYDSNNRPLVMFSKTQSEGAGTHYNTTYTFWDGSSWTPTGTLTVNHNYTTFFYLIMNADFFSDDNAILTWVNKTTPEPDNDAIIYYALGNLSEMGPFKTAFTLKNLTGLAMKVDNNDRAIMVWSNLTGDTVIMQYSIYDRDADSWSSPTIFHTADLGGNLLAPVELDFNSNNKGLLAVYEFRTDGTKDGFYFFKWNGLSWDGLINATEQFISIDAGGIYSGVYDNNDKLISEMLCRAEEFDPELTGKGMCYITYDGKDFSTTFMQETSFSPSGVSLDPELYKNQDGSLVLTFCSYNGTYHNMYLTHWLDDHFAVPEAVDFAMPLLPQSSCPFLYSWNGSDYVFEHESYGFAVFRGWEYTSHERLENLAPIDGLLKIKLSEELDEVSYTDSLILKAIEHDKGLEVLPDLEGNIHTIKEWHKPSSCVDYDSLNCLSLINEADGYHWRTNFDNKDFSKDEDLRDGLIIEFDKPEGIVEPKLFLRLRDSGFLRMGGETIIETLGSNNINYFYNLFSDAPIISDLIKNWRKGVAEMIVSVWDGSEWVEVESFGVGSAAWNEVLILIGEVNTEKIRIKLESSSGVYLIDEAKIDYSRDEEVRVIELEPINLASELLTNEGVRLALNKGSSVEATYKSISEDGDKAYTYITSIRGYYEIIPPVSEVKLDLSVYAKVLALLDPKVTAKEVYNRLFDLNLKTGIEKAQLISSLSLLGIIALIAVIIALI